MSAQRSPAHRHLRRLALAWSLAAVAWPLTAWADTVQLKGGRVIEGDVVREDGEGVMVVTRSGPEIVSRRDVEQIRYSRLHLAPSTQPSAGFTSAAPSGGVMDLTLLTQLRHRLDTFAELPEHVRRIALAVSRHHDVAAARETARMVRALWEFPIGRERALWIIADLLLVILLWAPSIWLGLALARESRSLTQIVVFLCAAYGVWLLSATFLLVPLAGSSTGAALWFMLGGIALGWGGLLAAFGWVFALPWTAVAVACGAAATVVAVCQAALSRL